MKKTLMILVALIMMCISTIAYTQDGIYLPFNDSAINLQQAWTYEQSMGGGQHRAFDFVDGVIDNSSTWSSFEVCASYGGSIVYIPQDATNGSSSWGNRIDHYFSFGGDQYKMVYAHLASSAHPVNEYVDAYPGMVVGMSGVSGAANNVNHLHWEVYKYVDDAPIRIDPYDIVTSLDDVRYRDSYYPNATPGVGPNNIFASGIPSLVATQQSAVGYFPDYYWDPSGTSQAFLDKYNGLISQGHNLGNPWNNGPYGVFLHLQNHMYIQDFQDTRNEPDGINNGYSHPYTALIRGEDADPWEFPFVLSGGFWLQWMYNCGWENYGYPISNEEPWINDDLSYTRQRFSKRFLAWRSGTEILVFDNDGNLVQDANVTCQNGTGLKVAGDGIYHSGQFVADFDQPIRLVVGETFSDMYAMIGGTRIDIDPFTVIGDMVITVGEEFDVPAPCSSGSIRVDNYAYDLAASNNYVYVTTNQGLKVVSVLDPANPVIVGSLETSGYGGVFASGNYVYVTNSGFENGQLKILDASTPTNPVVVGSVSMPAPEKVFVSGDYAYTAGQASSPKIVNVSDPTNPVIVGSINTYAVGIFVYGDYAYVVDTNDQMQVVDISDPTNPVIVGSVSTNSWSNARDLFVYGDYAYMAADNSGMKTIDISDPTNPVIVGSVSTSDARDIFVSGDYAYVADGDSGMKTIDISDPTNPVIINSTTTGGAGRIDVANNRIYLADGSTGLKIFQQYCGITVAVLANFVGGPITGDANLTVDFSDYSTGNATSWAWDFGDGGTSALQNPSHTYTTHGTYTVSLTVDNGSSTDTKTITDMIVATKYIPPEDPGVYPHETPNPFNPIAVISYKVETPQHVKLEVFDIRGRRVATLVDQVMGVGIHRARFDGRKNASGVYFYRLMDDSGTQVHKMTLLK